MKYEDFKAVCKWLQTEQVSLDLNEDEIKQEYSLFEDSNKAINYTHCCETVKGRKDHNIDIAYNGYCTKCTSRENKPI